MPYFSADYLKEIFVPAGSAFAAVLIWIIFQYVFKLDFQCPCDPKENTHVCVVYMIFPAISLFTVVMITDKRIRGVFCVNGTGIQYKRIILVMSIIKAFSVACLWIITALLDGDWYACLATTNYTLPPYKQSFCKKEEDRTPIEEADIQTKKSLSREYAIFVLFVVCVIWTFSAIRQSHCMRPLAYQYNDFLLEETDHYMKLELKTMAEDEAKTRGHRQINSIRSFLQQQQPERLPSRSALQASSDPANPELLDRSSYTSENFSETADTLPLLN